MVQRIKGTQNRSAGTREAIIAAVKRLWQGRAYDDITIAEIAAEAGIAKGSVLAHFSEKLAILAGFLASALDETSTQLEADAEFVSSPARLARKFEPLLVYLMADKALLRLLTLEGDGEQCAALLAPAELRLRDALTSGFKSQGHADPALSADVFMALAVQVAVASHSANPEAAVLALERLASVLYAR